MKKMFFIVLFILFSFTLISCKDNEKDNNVPVFDDIEEGKLPDLNIFKGNHFDLFDGVSAKNSINQKDVQVSITSFGNFNINRIGSYNITYSATNDIGKIATAERIVRVIEKNDDSENPVFENISNGFLPKLELEQGVEVDLLSDIIASDSEGLLLDVTIIDSNNFDHNTPGSYTIVYEAVDNKGNSSLAYRNVIVIQKSVIQMDALFINDNHTSYIYNNENALKHTSSGTQFRSFDQIQVMTKDFFISSFNENKKDHTNNGLTPFFSSGIIIIMDNDMKIKQMRLSTPLIQVDQNGSLKNSNLDWSNNIDPINGGGNFKNIIENMNELIPEGGYIMFAPPKDEQLSKKFLIKNLFDKNYTSGNISAANYNVDINLLEIRLGVYAEVVHEDEYENEQKNIVITKDKYLDGIPVTTYYFNDGKQKPVIFFFHGFASERKSGIATRGTELANQGFYVISMDAYLHGERMPNYFKDLSYGDKQKEIVNIQIQTALDAKRIFNKFYSRSKYVISDEVYSFGVSMGAGSSIYLSSILDEVNGVVSMLGSPAFSDFYKYKQKEYNWEFNLNYFNNLNSYLEHDPYLNSEIYKDKNIYFAGGSNDTVVPAIYAENFKALYPNNDNIIFKLYNTGHSSTPQMHTDIYNFLKSIRKN